MAATGPFTDCLVIQVACAIWEIVPATPKAFNMSGPRPYPCAAALKGHNKSSDIPKAALDLGLLAKDCGMVNSLCVPFRA